MAREMHTFDGQTAESAFWHEWLQQIHCPYLDCFLHVRYKLLQEDSTFKVLSSGNTEVFGFIGRPPTKQLPGKMSLILLVSAVWIVI